MNWNSKKRMCGTEEQDSPFGGMPPLIINTSNEQQQPSCGIRVVENKIMFYGEIEYNACLELNRLLYEVDNKLQSTRHVLGDDCLNPVINLHLNTMGGEIYSAFSTVDTIRNLKSRVHTHCDGLVASAGTLISIVGTKRYAGKYSHMLIHQLSSGTYGPLSEMENDINTCTNLMKLMKEFYKKYTKVPMKKMDELMKQDLYLTAEECLAYGIIDEIR